MKLSIRQQLLGGFSVVLALLVAAIVLSLITMGSLNSQANHLGGKDLRAVDAIGTIRSDTFGIRAADGDNIHAPNATVKQVTLAAIARSRAAVIAALQVYGQNTDGAADAKAFENVKGYVLTIIAGSDKAMAAGAKGDTQGAIAAYAAVQAALQPFDLGTAELSASRVKTGSQDVASASSSYSSARTILLVVGLVSLVIGLGLAVFLSERLTRGVRQLMRAADGIAQGDVEQTVDVKSRDELGETASAFGRMIEYLKSMARVADQVADGDLSVEVQPRGERDLLGNAFRRLVTKLGQAIGRVSTQAKSVTSASQQVAATSEESGRASGEIARAVGDVAKGAERQVQMVEQARQSAKEVARAVAESAEHAKATAAVARQAREAAEQGVGAAEQANEAMRSVRDSSQAVNEAIRELASKSEQIGAIVATITGIAEQTNLLALNAAIEAAR
ncbi:MAG: HAMP domain-containing protein, partial [Solirubrobacteraceae bacterium]